MAFDVNKIIMESLQEFEEEQQTITEQEVYMNPYEKYVGGTVAKGVDALKGTYKEAKRMWNEFAPAQPEGHTYTEEEAKRLGRASVMRGKRLAAEAEARRVEAEKAEAGELYPSQFPEEDKPAEAAVAADTKEAATDTAQQTAKKETANVAADTKEAATGTAQQVVKKTAKNVMDYDPNVSIKDYLRRAINRTGQAMGVKKSEWDTDAGGAGVQTHLAHAGKRFIQGLKDMEPEAVYPTAAAGAIAAGLGALQFAKKARKVGKQPA